MENIINKTMDYDDLVQQDAALIVEELNRLVLEMQRRKLLVSSWFGSFNLSRHPESGNMLNRGYGYQSLPGAADDTNFPWFKYWEIVWLIRNNDFKIGQKVLDLGGSSSLFSYYLASKGLDVTTIDVRQNLVDNGNIVAEKTGWALKNEVADMTYLATLSPREIQRRFEKSPFDHVTSVCVVEHLDVSDRIKLSSKIQHLLVQHGKFSITFDYQRPDKPARIDSPHDVHEQFIAPSTLQVRGNEVFFDNGKRYLLHPFYHKKKLWKLKISCILQGAFRPWEFFKVKNINDFTFGALFLEKE